MAQNPNGPRGSCGTPKCSSYHPDPPYIWFDGSRIKIGAARAITVEAVDPCNKCDLSHYTALKATNINILSCTISSDKIHHIVEGEVNWM